jgi:hypothetical protein
MICGALTKGEFLLGNKRYCYPRTVADHASRFPLLWIPKLRIPVDS